MRWSWNSTVKWHIRQRVDTEREEKNYHLESDIHSSHRTDTFHIPSLSHRSHHRHEACHFHMNMNICKNERENDNKLFWYFLFTSTAFSCVQFYGISGSASWCEWDVVDIITEQMDIVSEKSRMLFTTDRNYLDFSFFRSSQVGNCNNS